MSLETQWEIKDPIDVGTVPYKAIYFGCISLYIPLQGAGFLWWSCLLIGFGLKTWIASKIQEHR